MFNSANLALQETGRSVSLSNSSESLPLPPASFSGEPSGNLSIDGPTVLKLKARKPSRDGTLKPAQASEIYLTTQDLKELLKDLSADPAVAGKYVRLLSSGQGRKKMFPTIPRLLWV